MIVAYDRYNELFLTSLKLVYIDEKTMLAYGKTAYEAIHSIWYLQIA